MQVQVQKLGDGATDQVSLADEVFAPLGMDQTVVRDDAVQAAYQQLQSERKAIFGVGVKREKIDSTWISLHGDGGGELSRALLFHFNGFPDIVFER